MTNVGGLQDEAEKRRERLRSLRGVGKNSKEQRKDDNTNTLPKYEYFKR